ncbi:MAG: Fe-S cluster assembly protein SufB [bacterium]
MKEKKDSSNNTSSPEDTVYKTERGLTQDIVRAISAQKQEPVWMLELRLQALKEFFKKPMPSWGPDLSALNMHDLYYYLKPVKQQQRTWDDVPQDIKETFERLGVPEAEKEFLAGLGAQFESEMIYHNIKKEWEDLGIIFLDTDSGLKHHEEMLKKYFGSVVPYTDNKFAALNTAVWSGGSFIYIPKGIHVTLPLQTYFRINAEKMGQFERTLIIIDQDAQVSYIEGCTAPTYQSNSLHSAVVEIIALPGSRIRYYTIQNWSKNVYNLVTKRAIAHQNAVVEWIDCNIGSGVTMKYPNVILQGAGSKADILSLAMATSPGQIQDSGGKVIHQAPNTSSHIISKSISKNGGQASYRGTVIIEHNATNAKSFVQCNALILDNLSRADAYPYIDVNQSDVDIGHEATVSTINDEKLFYLMSKGLCSHEARTLIVNGFIEPLVKILPMEFAIEMNRLIELNMEESNGS